MTLVFLSDDTHADSGGLVFSIAQPFRAGDYSVKWRLGALAPLAYLAVRVEGLKAQQFPNRAHLPSPKGLGYRKNMPEVVHAPQPVEHQNSMRLAMRPARYHHSPCCYSSAAAPPMTSAISLVI